MFIPAWSVRERMYVWALYPTGGPDGWRRVRHVLRAGGTVFVSLGATYLHGWTLMVRPDDALRVR